MTPAVRFDEAMSGWVSFTELDFNPALAEGRRARRRMTVRVHMEIDDERAFERDPAHAARVSGRVECLALGRPLEIVGGAFHLLVDAPDARHREMVYRLVCRDAEGAPLTLVGVKPVADDPGADARRDVTTLFTRAYAGHVAAGDERAEDVVATGVLRLGPLQFLAQLRSMRGRGVARFGAYFTRRALGPYRGAAVRDDNEDFPVDTAAFWGRTPGVWHAVRDRPSLERRLVPYVTDDGLTLQLHHLRRAGGPAPTRGPVLLVHGAGGRPNFFYEAPMRTTFAEALLERGYDVWAQAWRGSIDDAPREWTLDEVAAFDHPAALATLARETGGAGPVRIVTQCQGATSYTIAAVAGLLPNVSHLLLGAVALHPVVPWRAEAKTGALLPGIRLSRMPWLDAQWGVRAPTALAGGVARMARVFRGRDCDEPACQVANFIYGSGPDCLWLHANLSRDVHHFLAREFGYCPVSFYRQMYASERAGHLVPARGTRGAGGLPDDYTAAPRGEVPRMTFACGDQNHVFSPEGQRRSFEHFAAFSPGRHEHLPWPRHGHLDPWVSRDAERAVFPSAIAAIER